MTNHPILLEPSFADLIAAIDKAADLPVTKRNHWICSVGRIAVALDKPEVAIPARWIAVRREVEALHHAPLGVTHKTLANHRANLRAALNWFCREHDISPRGAALTEDWQALWTQLEGLRPRANLSSLMRYCSASDILPGLVDETVVDRYMVYRGETTNLASDPAARRKIARTWNAQIGVVTGWPSLRLVEPPLKVAEGPAWEDFPEGLRRDIERYLGELTKVRKMANGNRVRPCNPKTIRVRRAKFVAAARMAVRIGIPIESLTSFAALLHPDVAERVLNAYWEKNGETPKGYTIDLAAHILTAARHLGCLDADAIARLDEMRAALEEHRKGGMTAKNLDVIRHVLTPGVWEKVCRLPAALMEEAHKLHDHAPVKAAVTAQIAVAIALLTLAPIRLANLGHIRVGVNLRKLNGPQSDYWLIFPDHDVKNRVPLEYMLDASLSALIDDYIHTFRPTLLRASNEAWLFPGEDGGPKTLTTLSGQITERIEAATGLRITPHQFRHAAGAIFLKHRPGEYEVVRRLLGHRNIQTTIQFYLGLETTQAGAIYTDVLRKEMRASLGTGHQPLPAGPARRRAPAPDTAR